MNLKYKQKGDIILRNKEIEGIITSVDDNELNIFLLFDLKKNIVKEFEHGTVLLGLILVEDFPFLMLKTESSSWMDSPLAIKIPSEKICKYHIAIINPKTHYIVSEVRNGVFPDTFKDTLDQYVRHRVNYFPTVELSQYRIKRIYNTYSANHFAKMKKTVAKMTL